MESTAFVSLEDISTALPPYEEQVIGVKMDDQLAKAYARLEEQIRDTIKRYPKDKGLRSIMLNALLRYPDHPFGWEKIIRRLIDRRTRQMIDITVATPKNLLDEQEAASAKTTFEKERRLIDDIKAELREGRRCQIYAVYTGKHDVTARIETVLKAKRNPLRHPPRLRSDRPA